jgi:pentatricopeptide repeat protein
MVGFGVKPNRITCSILLKGIHRNSSSANVTRILEVVDGMDDEIDDVLLSSTIEAILRFGRSDLLAMHLQRLRSAGKVQVKSPHTVGSLIRAHGYVGDIDGVWNVWTDMRKQHITPTSITLGCMVEALVTNGSVDAAYEVLHDMLNEPQCKASVNAVIFGSVLKGFSHQKRFDRVWSTYQEMLERKLVFSVITFNTLLDACARCGEMAHIPDLLDEMKGQAVEPSLITYSIVIKGYCQGNRLEEALQVWETMVQATNLQPDEIMYNTILDGCARQGLYAQGMGLLDEMQKSGIRPSNFTLSVLIKMASRAKLLDKAFEMCEELSQKHKIRLNVHVYSNLVQACATNNAIPRALEVLEEMVRQRVSPDARTYTLLIKACIAAGKIKDCSGLVRAALGLENAHPILAKSANFARLQNGLPCDLLVEILEGISGRCDDSVAALALWQAVKLTPGLKLPSRLQLRLARLAYKN